MRILKGQEILPDDSTLAQHNISDGDTVNIVIEPDKLIAIDIACQAEIFRHKMSSSVSVKDLKEKLIEFKQVVFWCYEFNLVAETSQGVVNPLEDSLPLHFYGFHDGSKLWVVRSHIFLTVVDHNKPDTPLSRKFSRKATVEELKRIILLSWKSSRSMSCDVLLYIKNAQNEYVKLDLNKRLEQVLSDGQTVYYIWDEWFDKFWSVMCGDREIGKVYGNGSQDTVGTIKLRIQDQLGIPTSCVTITRNVQQFAQRHPGMGGNIYGGYTKPVVSHAAGMYYVELPVSDGETMSGVAFGKIQVVSRVMQGSGK